MNEEFIRLIAERTAEVIGLDFVPEFVRWTKRGGYAKRRYYNKVNTFTLPLWLKNENTYYQTAYIAHEVCHFVSGIGSGHNPSFYDAERSALAAWGMEPVYEYGLRYPVALTQLETKVLLWTKVDAVTKTVRTRLSYGEGRY